jgi:hypothetical protein
MRSIVFASFFLLACGSSDAPSSTGAGGAGSSTSASTASSMPSTSATMTSSSTAPMCASGQTMCGAACSDTSDCDHAVTVVGSNNVYVNGQTFASLVLAKTSDVAGVTVGGAAVASLATDATHVKIEIPPNVVGLADVAVTTTAGTTVTTKGAINDRTYPEGTTWVDKIMKSARGGFPGMTTTSDDRGLIAGGYTTPTVADCTDTADLYDKTSDTMKLAADSMNQKHWTASAVTLLDGTTIVAGGCYGLDGCPYDSTIMDRFDPSMSEFTTDKAVLTQKRSYLRELRLADGRVLFASAESPALDLFDPKADTVTATASAATNGFLARLRDGKVLIVPGVAPNLIYDPATDTVTPTGDALDHAPDALIAVDDGRVFAIGGNGTTANGMQGSLAEIDVFDPSTKLFSKWSWSLQTPRNGSTSIYARDGRIFVIGGLSGPNPAINNCNDNDTQMNLASVEILNPDAKTDADAPVVAGPSLDAPTASARSTILSDGSILVAGGTTCGMLGEPSSNVLYFLEAPPDPIK